MLVGGEPGIGKSTLMLQLAARVATPGRSLYVSGEESPGQLRMRADRLRRLLGAHRGAGGDGAHRDHAGPGAGEARAHHRGFPPDPLHPGGQRPARHGQPDQGLHAGAGGVGALARVRASARGPRDQGRDHRRAEAGRAPRGHGAVLRAGERGGAHAPGGEEQVRLGGRDRLLPHDGARACRGGGRVQPLPHPARRRDPRRGSRWRRCSKARARCSWRSRRSPSRQRAASAGSTRTGSTRAGWRGWPRCWKSTSGCTSRSTTST